MTLAIDYYQNYRNLAQSKPQINQLVNAADPLFAIAINAQKLTNLPEPKQLQKFLATEIEDFALNVANSGYNESLINDACFILCDFIDDIIATTPWGQNHNWQQNGLLTIFLETNKSNNFFTLLKHAADNPILNIDLLELIYLCLSLGYSGKFREQKHGQTTIAAIKTDLYELIKRHTKANPDSALLVHNVTDHQQIIHQRKIKKMPLSLLFSLASVVTLGLIIFFTLNAKLDKSTNPVTKIIKNISVNTD